ncbi:hypothetical protein [Oscillibacter sp. 1-3]|uniref:hypothetical protein n=1 Tax=Oscillibacter sp. 1-3 TaxID=1235797 RepID=UPI001A9870E2|nr:hypothetical protein [Oscillibacter sp. 1-3]
MSEPEDGSQARKKTAKERGEQKYAFTNQNNHRQHPRLEAMPDSLSHMLLTAAYYFYYTVFKGESKPNFDRVPLPLIPAYNGVTRGTAAYLGRAVPRRGAQIKALPSLFARLIRRRRP